KSVLPPGGLRSLPAVRLPLCLRVWVVLAIQHRVQPAALVRLDDAQPISALDRKPTHVESAEAVADGVMLKVERWMLMAATAVRAGEASSALMKPHRDVRQAHRQ